MYQKQITSLFLFFLFVCFPYINYTQSCFETAFQKGQLALENQDFDKAKSHLINADDCSDKPIDFKLSAWLDTIRKKQIWFLERSVRAQSNAQKALLLSATDPTLALRMAEMNYHLYPELGTMGDAFAHLISDTLNAKALRTIQYGHTSYIYNVAFSPDRQYVLTGSADKTARLWNIKTGEVTVLNGHSAPIRAVTFSSDGQFLLTGSRDETAKLWDLKGNEVRTFQGHTDNIYGIVCSPDGKHFLTVSRDGREKLWNIDGREIRTFESNPTIYIYTTITFSPDGKYILRATSDSLTVLNDLEGNEIQRYESNKELISALVFSPDGKYILSSSSNGIVRLRTIDGEEKLKFKKRFTPFSLAFSPDGKYLLINDTRSVEIRDLQGNEIQKYNYRDQIITAVFSSDGQRVLAVDPKKGIDIRDMEGSRLPNIVLDAGSVESATFSPDGQYILTGAGHEDNTARLWDLHGNLHQSFSEYLLRSAVFSPDGNHIMTLHLKNINLWDRKGNRLKNIYYSDVHMNLYAAAFSPDGKHILASYDKSQSHGVLVLWDLEGNKIQSFTSQPDRITTLAFSPDGAFILTGSKDHSMTLWDLQGNELLKFEGHKDEITAIAFSPDGQYIASGSKDNKVKLWDMKGNVITTFHGHSRAVTSLTFHPFKPYILSGSEDNTAKLWHRNGYILKNFIGHTGVVNTVDISSDGRYILTGSDDRSVKLWALDQYRIKKLDLFSKKRYTPSAVQFLKDGKQLILKSDNYTLKFYNLENDQSREFNKDAGKIVFYRMSPDEKYIAISSDNPGEIKIWKLDGTFIRSFAAHSKAISNIEFSSDGQHILTNAEDEPAKLWTIEGKFIQSFLSSTERRSLAVFSPDDQYIAIWYLHKPDLKLFNWHGEYIQTLDLTASALGKISFSKKNKHILATSWSETTKMWDWQGNLIQNYHKGYNNSRTVFSHDNRYLFINFFSNPHETAELWDFQGNVLQRFVSHSETFKHLDVSPDNQYLLLCESDGILKIYPTPWSYLEKYVEEFPLSQLKSAGLEYTQEDLEHMMKRGKQW